MRLTLTQLRSIIAEEVSRVKRGRRLSEGFDVNAVVDRAYAEFYADASAAFDEDDPTMDAQVDGAAEAFRDELDAALKSTPDAAPHRTVASVKSSVMRKLLNGEYA